MEVTAIYDSWYRNDGNYPALRKGQPVNLSFEVTPADSFTVSNGTSTELFLQDTEARCRFCALIIRTYEDLVVLQASGFCFYIQKRDLVPMECGNYISGSGWLNLDPYHWAESIGDHEHPPNLFYTCRIIKIRKIGDEGSGTWVEIAMPNGTRQANIQEIEDMTGERFKGEFYLLELDDSGCSEVEGSDVPLIITVLQDRDFPSSSEGII
jgi:hypothetical protein